jgi:hypothetical protein
MPESMRERIEQAITVWMTGNHPGRLSDAVLDAMREPDAAMIDAAYDAHDAYEQGDAPKTWFGLTSAWRAMIDHIRGES